MKNNKNVFVTIVVGFIFGLVISGILGDLISFGISAVERISCSWSVSKAEKYIADGDFEKAKIEYEKILNNKKIDNQKIIAKVKNNLALIIFTQGDKENNLTKIENSIKMFSQSLEIYERLKDVDSIKKLKNNIEQAQKVYLNLQNENNILEY